jgi:two-component system sensor histidine kinase RegB
VLQQQPIILRRPEIIHGIRNLIQNAVDFAATTVWIETEWSNDLIVLRIMDDGRGYPPSMIGRIGEPFVRRRSQSLDQTRPEYEGMGLGLFIAKTLLERCGAELSFANGTDSFATRASHSERTGAFVEVKWPRPRLEARSGGARKALGENAPIKV